MHNPAPTAIRRGNSIPDAIALRNLTGRMLGAAGAGRCPVFELIAARAEDDRAAIFTRHAASCAERRARFWSWED